MMNLNNHSNNVTSLESLESTIRTDSSVRRWFTHLINIPTIQAQLKSQKDCVILYKNLKKNTLQLNLILSLIFMLFLAGAFLQKKIIFLIIIPLWPLWLSYSTNKELVIKISRNLIMRDFQDEWLNTSSLYQIGEYYSKTYGVSSLVDHIYTLDMLTKSIFFLFILYEYIEPHKTIVTVLLFMGVYFLIMGLLRIKHIYTFLNKISW